MSRFQSTMYVRVPQELRQRIAEEARRRMLRDSDIVREAVAEHLNHTPSVAELESAAAAVIEAGVK